MMFTQAQRLFFSDDALEEMEQSRRKCLNLYCNREKLGEREFCFECLVDGAEDEEILVFQQEAGR